MATLVAQRAGVPVLPEVAVGSTADGDAVLVTRLDGRRFAMLTADEITGDHLEAAWRALASLHAAGLSHGRIDGDRVLVAADGRVLLADLAEAELAPSPADIATDRRAAPGDDRRAHRPRTRRGRRAVTVLEPDDLAAVLPFLQPAVLDRVTRKAVAKGNAGLKRLRAAAADAAEVQPPPLQKLRRVTLKSVLITVGGTLLAYYLITQLAGVDSTAIADQLATANWWWIAGALLLSPVRPSRVRGRHHGRVDQAPALPAGRHAAMGDPVRRPRNLTEMLAGHLWSAIDPGRLLGLCLQAFGADAHFSQLVLVNTLVSLFAGLLPVPGGVGVAEAGYTACLQAIGIPSAIAISTALTFRLVTFYLPPLWGSVSMAWPRRLQYV